MHFDAIGYELGRGLVLVGLSEEQFDPEGILEPFLLVLLERVAHFDPGRRVLCAEGLRDSLDADVLAGVFVFEAEFAVEGEGQLLHSRGNFKIYIIYCDLNFGLALGCALEFSQYLYE
jgi:hypothetical protein